MLADKRVLQMGRDLLVIGVKMCQRCCVTQGAGERGASVGLLRFTQGRVASHQSSSGLCHADEDMHEGE